MNNELTNRGLSQLKKEEKSFANRDRDEAFFERLAKLESRRPRERRVLWTDTPQVDGIHRRGPVRNSK